MSNFTDFFPAAGGGGLTPKFEEFLTSGTFTPSQALIDAGGYIDVFLVGGGGRSLSYPARGSTGGEVIMTRMYLTSATGCAVTIGAGGQTNGAAGSRSVFTGTSAGGSDVTSAGGSGSNAQSGKSGSGWGANSDYTGGSGVLGYGAGSSVGDGMGGVYAGKANTGQGSYYNQTSGSGYCLVKYYE
jgi:hypothetical protein